MENVIVLGFGGADPGRSAVQALRRLQDADDVRLEAAAVLERTLEGQIRVRDLVEEFHLRATASGGLIGALIGILTGPFGMVIGGATGAAVGSLIDVADAENADQLVRVFGKVVRPGSAATIAVAYERTPTAVETIAAELGGSVLRRARAEVEQEVAEAEEAVLAARREAEGKRTVGDRLRDVKDAVLDRR